MFVRSDLLSPMAWYVTFQYGVSMALEQTLRWIYTLHTLSHISVTVLNRSTAITWSSSLLLESVKYAPASGRDVRTYWRSIDSCRVHFRPEHTMMLLCTVHTTLKKQSYGTSNIEHGQRTRNLFHDYQELICHVPDFEGQLCSLLR